MGTLSINKVCNGKGINCQPKLVLYRLADWNIAFWIREVIATDLSADGSNGRAVEIGRTPCKVITPTSEPILATHLSLIGGGKSNVPTNDHVLAEVGSVPW